LIAVAKLLKIKRTAKEIGRFLSPYAPFGALQCGFVAKVLAKMGAKFCRFEKNDYLCSPKCANNDNNKK